MPIIIKFHRLGSFPNVSGAAAAGKTQSTTYYPYGEPHRRPASSPGRNSDNRYLFGDKEYTDYDGESQLDFGARHLAPSVIPRFTTMDPLCEERPDESPYIFAAANPVMNIDPDGRKTYAVDSVGYITKITDDKEFDKIVTTKDGKTEEIWRGKHGTIQQAYFRYEVKGENKKYVGEYFIVDNDNDGLDIFESLAEHYSGDNKHVEWSIIQTSDDDLEQFNYIMTSHLESREIMLKKKFKDFVGNKKIRNVYHCHPKNTPRPSGLPQNPQMKKRKDIQVADWMIKKARYDINFKIYLPGLLHYITYTPNSVINDFP